MTLSYQEPSWPNVCFFSSLYRSPCKRRNFCTMYIMPWIQWVLQFKCLMMSATNFNSSRQSKHIPSSIYDCQTSAFSVPVVSVFGHSKLRISLKCFRFYIYQGHSTTVFCKLSVRRSKYCLDFSITWGRLKISRWPFHSRTFFEAYLTDTTL